jgi:hypothetical protein
MQRWEPLICPMSLKAEDKNHSDIPYSANFSVCAEIFKSPMHMKKLKILKRSIWSSRKTCTSKDNSNSGGASMSRDASNYRDACDNRDANNNRNTSNGKDAK